MGFAASFAALVPYADGPPPAHTGGFGEPTCRTCQFDGPLNDPSGSMTLEGLPARYEPGRRYEVSVRVSRPGLERGGFQLAARFADGPTGGVQAGAGIVEPPERRGARVAVVEKEGIPYARHTASGSRRPVDAESGTISWRVVWAAPREGATPGVGATADEGPTPVVFHLGANAANDDDPEFGDWISADAVRILHAWGDERGSNGPGSTADPSSRTDWSEGADPGAGHGAHGEEPEGR